MLPRDWAFFDREVEKVVSVSAGVASAAFSVAAGEAAHFDARVWVGGTDADVVDYFRWRQSDATRCALNGWVYWTLRNEGATVAEATRAMERQSVGWKNEALFVRGINFNEVPLWQRRGIGLFWEAVEIQATNPLTGEATLAVRRRLVEDGELPMKDEYGRYVANLLEEGTRSVYPPVIVPARRRGERPNAGKITGGYTLRVPAINLPRSPDAPAPRSPR